MKEKTLIAVMFGLLAGIALAQSGGLSAQDRNAPECEETMTIFQDVSRVGRKDRAASNMTRWHSEVALERWKFADMEVHIENGDIEGFYLSYTRASPHIA